MIEPVRVDHNIGQCLFGQSIADDIHGIDKADAVERNNLAQLLKTTNRLQEAEPLMRRHVVIFRKFGDPSRELNPEILPDLPPVIVPPVSSNFGSLLAAAAEAGNSGAIVSGAGGRKTLNGCSFLSR